MNIVQTNLVGDFLPEYSVAKSVVGKVLKENEESRNSDRELIREVMVFCIMEDIRIPPSETITRARRKFQEEGLYLPTDDVAIARRRKEVFYRTAAEGNLL